MPDKEWIIPRGPFAILIRRRTVGGRVRSFAVVLLTVHGGKWIDVTRYDTAHGYAHRDVLGISEGLRGKIRLPTVDYNKAFRYAIRDLEHNAEIYLADYLAH